MMDKSFLAYAASVLADTNTGLSGSQICKYCNQYAVKFGKSIKHTTSPFHNGINKAQALGENLACFEPEEQFLIIQNLCDLESFLANRKIQEVKDKLISQYAYLAPQAISECIIESVQQVRHWLDDYPEAKKHYESAIEKRNNHIYERNLLDDLRLSFELLIRSILGNDKSLENQKSELGNYFINKGVNKEISNFYTNLVFGFFATYQNNKVKHNDLFNDIEIDFVFNQTTILMQFLITLDKQHS